MITLVAFSFQGLTLLNQTFILRTIFFFMKMFLTLLETLTNQQEIIQTNRIISVRSKNQRTNIWENIVKKTIPDIREHLLTTKENHFQWSMRAFTIVTASPIHSRSTTRGLSDNSRTLLTCKSFLNQYHVIRDTPWMLQLRREKILAVLRPAVHLSNLRMTSIVVPTNDLN